MRAVGVCLVGSTFVFLLSCAGQEGPPPAATAAPAPLGAGPLVLAKGFAREARQGETAGAVEVTACKLWVADEPDFTMTLQDTMSSALKVRLTRGDGASPVVRFRGGTFCPKVVDGLPTVERGAWSKDTYDVYVGVPERGRKVQYALEVVEN